MTRLPTLRALIVAAAAVASPLLASSLPAAAAREGAKTALTATAKTGAFKASQSALVRQPNQRCSGQTGFHCP